MPPTIRKATTEPGVEPGRRPVHTMEGLLGVLILLTLGLQQYQLAPFGWIMLGEFAAVLAFWATWWRHGEEPSVVLTVIAVWMGGAVAAFIAHSGYRPPGISFAGDFALMIRRTVGVSFETALVMGVALTYLRTTAQRRRGVVKRGGTVEHGGRRVAKGVAMLVASVVLMLFYMDPPVERPISPGGGQAALSRVLDELVREQERFHDKNGTYASDFSQLGGDWPRTSVRLGMSAASVRMTLDRADTASWTGRAESVNATWLCTMTVKHDEGAFPACTEHRYWFGSYGAPP